MTTVPQATIAVRPAVPEDAPQIAAVGALSWTTAFGYSVQPHELQAFLDETYTPQVIAKDLQAPNREMVVATDEGGSVIGFIQLTRDSVEPCLAHLESTVELQRIYVHPDFQGKGVGKLLMNTVFDMARKYGYRYIWLGCWVESHNGLKVYDKMGFKIVGGHDFHVGGAIQRDHILLREL